MRQRSPVLIAKEYVQASEPAQVRKNALTALAQLGDPDGWAVLTEVALTDLDVSVRDQAEEELSRMSPESAAQAMEPVLASLDVQSTRGNAYVLLGRLRNRGMTFRVPPKTFAVRLSLAKAMRDHLYPKRGFRFHFRTVKGITTGTFLAWLATVVFCAALLDIHLEPVSTLGYLFMGWLLALALGITATVYTSPARCYADIKGGALLDMLVAASVGFALSLGIVLLIWVMVGRGLVQENYQYVLLLSGPLAAAAVRFGTLSVFGMTRKPWLNRLVQLAVGGTCGIAVFDLALLGGDGSDELLTGVWTMMLIASYGLAAAFAWIDSRSLLLPVVSRHVRAMGLLVASIGLLFPLSLLIPPLMAETDLGAVGISKEFPVQRLPASVKFQTNSASRLRVAGDRYSEALVWNEGEEKAVEWANRYEPLDLPAGRYRVSLSDHRTGDVSIFGALPELAKELSWAPTRARLAHQAPERGGVTGSTTLVLEGVAEKATALP
jgi:hypothetical protein